MTAYLSRIMPVAFAAALAATSGCGSSQERSYYVPMDDDHVNFLISNDPFKQAVNAIYEPSPEAAFSKKTSDIPPSLLDDFITWNNLLVYTLRGTNEHLDEVVYRVGDPAKFPSENNSEVSCVTHFEALYSGEPYPRQPRGNIIMYIGASQPLYRDCFLHEEGHLWYHRLQRGESVTSSTALDTGERGGEFGEWIGVLHRFITHYQYVNPRGALLYSQYMFIRSDLFLPKEQSLDIVPSILEEPHNKSHLGTLLATRDVSPTEHYVADVEQAVFYQDGGILPLTEFHQQVEDYFSGISSVQSYNERLFNLYMAALSRVSEYVALTISHDAAWRFQGAQACTFIGIRDLYGLDYLTVELPDGAEWCGSFFEGLE